MDVKALCTAGPPGVAGNWFFLSAADGDFVIQDLRREGSLGISMDYVDSVSVHRGGKPVAGGFSGALLGAVLLGPLGALAGGALGAAKGGFSIQLEIHDVDNRVTLFEFTRLDSFAVNGLLEALSNAKAQAAALDSAETDEVGLRDCPWCAERIKAAARVCRYCGREVGPESTSQSSPKPATISNKPLQARTARSDSRNMPDYLLRGTGAHRYERIIDWFADCRRKTQVVSIPNVPDERVLQGLLKARDSTGENGISVSLTPRGKVQLVRTTASR